RRLCFSADLSTNQLARTPNVFDEHRLYPYVSNIRGELESTGYELGHGQVLRLQEYQQHRGSSIVVPSTNSTTQPNALLCVEYHLSVASVRESRFPPNNSL
ncbi:hypothetical protein M405DRAFT_931988, partial [Rhizopogon salebrosus TDB-379]